MNRLDEYVKKMTAEDQKRVRFAVRELLILVCKIEAWGNIDMNDLLMAVTSKKEQEDCLEENERL